MLVGYVTGSEETSPYEFLVRVRSKPEDLPETMLKIGDILKTSFYYPNHGRITIYAMVTEIFSSWDGDYITGFEESMMIEKKLRLPMRTFMARVVTTRIVSETSPYNPPDVPPVPGSAVYLVDGEEEVNVSLGFDDLIEKKKALPVGILPNGAVAYVDLDYILGDNGAHINISGQSGVASKTSYMTFLMRSLVDHVGSPKPIFIVFNVKGQGLMFLDRGSDSWSRLKNTPRGRIWQDMYRRMGVKPEPFDRVEFYAVRKDYLNSKPDSIRSSARSYFWSSKDIFDSNLFEMVFDPDELARNSNLMLGVMMITEYMEDVGWRRINDPYDLVKNLKETESKLVQFLLEEGKGIPRSTVKLLQRRIQLAAKTGLDLLWHKDASEESRINWNRPGGITVIDISKLRTRMQSLVVGAVLKDILREKERGNLMGVPVFILIDELNKYSPRNERSEIASIFRDVAERGRSFGIILVGAEQTASEVDYRVVTQASTTVVGRQKWVELQKSEYGHLLPEQKRKVATLRQGEMIIDQPFLRVPILVRFPYPAWALREDDFSEENMDIERLLT